MKKIFQNLVPNILWKLFSNVYRTFFKRKIQVHIEDIFGCDLYQNSGDIIDYSKEKEIFRFPFIFVVFPFILAFTGKRFRRFFLIKPNR